LSLSPFPATACSSLYLNPAIDTTYQEAIRAIDPLLDVPLEASLGYHRIIPEPPAPPLEEQPIEEQPSLSWGSNYYANTAGGAVQPLMLEVEAGTQQQRGQPGQEQPAVVLKFRASGWQQAGGAGAGQLQEEQTVVVQLGSNGWQVRHAEEADAVQQQEQEQQQQQ
jgi:hypothetical protein